LEEKQNGKEKLHGRACADCERPREKPSPDARELDGGAAQAQVKQLAGNVTYVDFDMSEKFRPQGQRVTSLGFLPTLNYQVPS
jgi:hypothetical protein